MPDDGYETVVRVPREPWECASSVTVLIQRTEFEEGAVDQILYFNGKVGTSVTNRSCVRREYSGALGRRLGITDKVGGRRVFRDEGERK